jgi:murein L,D-transpeptidase YafK
MPSYWLKATHIRDKKASIAGEMGRTAIAYTSELMIRHAKLGGLLLLAVLLSPRAFTQGTIDRILVLKSEHRLLLMRGTETVKSYSVALGSGGPAPKWRQGDHKTPEGYYRIDWRNSHSRFHLGLHISYPNEEDREHARKLGVSPGGDILVHGLGSEFKWLGVKHRFYDWTDGCIAVTDLEIEEIWRLVGVGTIVEIRH